MRFEIALNTVLQLKDYNDFMIDDIDICLRRLFIDWAESKLNSGGEGGGVGGERRLSMLNDELGENLRRKEELEKQNAELIADLTLAKKRIVDMAPDNKRAKELADRNAILNSTLQETQAKFEDLDITNKGLVASKTRLEVCKRARYF